MLQDLYLKKTRSTHVTPLLKELHWLPIYLRIDFKIALFVYKSLNNLAPVYIKDLLSPYVPKRALRSMNKNSLVDPVSHLKNYGDRSFASYAPRVWNKIPLDIRSSNKKKLKTHYFSLHFGQ